MATSKRYFDLEYSIRNQRTKLKLIQYSSPNEIRDAIRWVMRDNPDIFWFAHQYHYDKANSTIHFQYTFSEERVKTIQQSINDVIDNDFCIGYVKTLTRQQQIIYVYKWLVSYCNYNANSAYNQSIYSVFVRRNSVCTGYAKAAQYLFNLLGLESRLVFGRLHNDKEDGRHCWNFVKVDNGYYHFDVCFGDSILDNVAIKSGVQKLFKIDGINYNFLCVSTDEILRTRNIEDITTLPDCPNSWSKTLINSLALIKLKQREDIKGCLLSHIGSSADIYLCSKDKNTVLKVFRPDSKTTSSAEYHYMQQTKGCRHLLQCDEQYTDITQNSVAIEQSTPIVDLLCSHYYELSLKGLIKMATDVAKAWKECQKRGVLYRDIHVCNIYRSNDGIFKLGDFGSCTNKFDLKETVGNQWFMAPETFVSGIFTESSAIYSLSMVMYFILNNLRPVFWRPGCEDEALRTRMNGHELPTPIGCINIPSHLKTKLDNFFRSTSASLPKERISSIEKFIYELEKLTSYCGYQDYVIHSKGISLTLDLDAGNSHRLDERWDYIHRDARHRYAMGDEVEQKCTTARFTFKSKMKECENGHIYDSNIYGSQCPFCPSKNIGPTKGKNSWFIWRWSMPDRPTVVGNIAHADEVENFARTMAANPDVPSTITPIINITDEVESYSSTMGFCENKCATYNATVQKSKKSIWSKLFGNRYNEVYSSIFAPAEVKRKSHLQVQVYLHLYEESEKVKSLAQESDKNAERRDYIPLSLKLKKGDKVDVEFNVYGESRLMSERKSIIWQGAFTKRSFDYFVPKDIDVEELSCVALLSVNGVPIGEMRFITRVIETPRQLNPEIIAHKYSKVFISYSHQDESKVKFLHEGLELGSVPHFFDRKYLKAGDVFPQVIQDYIN
ncbi:MAG: protein kinase [Muribaculaceae bacterium]|nr:protein kinase [Muribaculaceae bacterium]